MYVRFVDHHIDWASGKRRGIFRVAGALRRSGCLTAPDAARLTEIESWFDENLRKPTRFARSRTHHPRAVAISWFKSGAREHIRRMNAMRQLLETYGYTIEMLKTRRPGYVVYEDEAQVAAKPFSETPA